MFRYINYDKVLFLNRGYPEIRSIHRTKVIAILTLFVLTASCAIKEPSYVKMPDQKEVIIIGETHRRPESAELVTNTVTEYLQDGRCLTVGLEIPSHQQPILDRAFNGKWIPVRFPISSIPLSGIIDHRGYRKMLASFRDQIRQGKCLKVRAIDKPHIVPLDRDEWMERQILEMMDGTPILVLAGNFHAMKEVKWSSEPLGGTSLAERLVNRGIKVTSMLQYWERDGCSLRIEKLVSTEEPESWEYLEQIMHAIHAKAPDKAYAVADAVVVWRCADWSYDYEYHYNFIN